VVEGIRGVISTGLKLVITKTAFIFVKSTTG
jgi:hypothetical protein